jgi:hypothetical protein
VSGQAFVGQSKSSSPPTVVDRRLAAGGRTGQDRGTDIKSRTNQRFFSKVSYTAPGTLLAGYRLGALAPISRDESAVRAIQRPGVRP